MGAEDVVHRRVAHANGLPSDGGWWLALSELTATPAVIRVAMYRGLTNIWDVQARGLMDTLS